ncbi:MAG TPA: adenylate/guanylate cyclase domain-containing protein [Beijerinckiaceae bacterium]|nr:adenylate/guanylate cyclase domain-containing protein [Beijerinckiaceae bacterium]
MNDSDIDRIATWLIERGLAGASETELLHGFCAACRQAGLELSRGNMLIDTLHPVHEGRAFRWHIDGAQSPVVEYGRTNEGGAQAESWQRSPYHALVTSGENELRRRLGEGPPDFPMLVEMRNEGETDYIAFVQRFARDSVIGEMDAVYSSWSTRRGGGFDHRELAALRRLVPLLALAAKCASLARIAQTLVEVYLGRDAGRRVLDGRISRGVAERINAVLWFSDLRSYTSISDRVAPDEIIPMLNDYADAVVSAVHAAGGDVLKLVADGVVAIFKADDPARACRCALEAERNLRARLVALNERRAGEGRPVTSVYLGLHIGDVFYGNIGSEERLDFTVIGPAVNEVSRIASMCASVDRDVVLSADFAAAAAPAERGRLVSVGRFALRGVARAQELFTIDPAAA